MVFLNAQRATNDIPREYSSVGPVQIPIKASQKIIKMIISIINDTQSNTSGLSASLMKSGEDGGMTEGLHRGLRGYSDAHPVRNVLRFLCMNVGSSFLCSSLVFSSFRSQILLCGDTYEV